MIHYTTQSGATTLVSTRRPGEAFQIFDNITITFREVSEKKSRIAIGAPHEVPGSARRSAQRVRGVDDGSQPHPVPVASA